MKQLLRSFGGGAISPDLLGRIDDARYASSVARMENFDPNPRGPADKRRGTERVARAKSDATMQLVPFKFSTEQQLMVGIGAGFFRWYALGAPLLYARTQTPANIDPGTEILTFTSPHGFVGTDTVRVFAFDGGGALPTPLDSDTDYTVDVVDAWRIQLQGVNLSDAGTGAIRVVRSSEVPRQYVPSRYVSAINLDTEVFDFGADHLLQTADPICLIPVTHALPSPLLPGLAYYAIIVDAQKIKLATTAALAALGTAISIAGTAVTFDDVADKVLWSAHGLANGDKVTFGSASFSPPLELVVGVTYFVINKTAGDFQVSATSGGAAINFSASPGAVAYPVDARMHFVYERGDHIYLTGAGTGFYHAIERDPRDNAPPAATTFWYRLPDDGTLEIPNSIAADELHTVDHAVSGDVLRLSHVNHVLGELTRLSAVSWTWYPTSLLPPLSPPQNLTATPSYGMVVAIITVQVVSGSFNYLQTAGGVAHGLGLGDVVAIAGLAAKGIVDGKYVVAKASGPASQVDEFALRYAETGLPVTAISTGGVTGEARVTELGKDGSNTYKVAALDSDGVESQTSTPVTVANNLFVTGASNLLQWSAVLGATRYRVYRLFNGLPASIGETDSTSFTDSGPIEPSLDKVAPTIDTTIAAGGRPRAVALAEQRLCLGGFHTAPQRTALSRTGAERDFSVHLPVKADDRISVDVPLDGSPVRHLVSVPAGLLVLTTGAEMLLSAGSDQALAPETARLRVLSRAGSDDAMPVVLHDRALFVAQRGKHVLQVVFDDRGSGAVDLCVRAPHYFDGFSIVQLASLQSPTPMVFALRSDGKVLVCSFLPNEEVLGWAILETAGQVESIGGMQDGDEDALYMVVRAGSTRSVQRMQAAMHLDDAVVYDGLAPHAGTLELSGGVGWGVADLLTATTSLYEAIVVGDLLRAYVDVAQPDGSNIRYQSTCRVESVIDGLSYRVRPTAVVPTQLRTAAVVTWQQARRRILTPHASQSLKAMADGLVEIVTTDADGWATLKVAAYSVVIGRPFAAEIETLPLALPQDPGGGKGVNWVVNLAFVGAAPGLGFQVGARGGRMAPVVPRSDEERTQLPAKWQQGGVLVIRSDDPWPVSLRYLALDLVAAT